MFSRAGFTLIELLVVIAIIAVLSVVVVLSLNPAELLRQSRDANRLSDLSTLNSALALYTTDQAGVSGFSLGNASSVYVSLPDSSSTCGNLGLPALPSGYTYACVASTSTKNINNSGWIPVNFGAISGGAPFSNLPIDGVNQSSTGLYYTYYSNGSQFIVTAIPESQKQKAALGVKSIIQNYPDVLANGSNLNISPLFSAAGLVGYWNFDEGTGTFAYDQSGNGITEQWYGTMGNQYTANAKVGSYAGQFNGINNDMVSTGTMANPPNGTILVWVNPSSNMIPPPSNYPHMVGFGNDPGLYIQKNTGKPYLQWGASATVCPQVLSANTWQFLAGTWPTNQLNIYINGSFCNSTTITTNPSGSTTFTLTGSQVYTGLIDDLRVYNRVLSPAEIQAIYNAGR